MLIFELTQDKTVEVFFDEEGQKLLLQALSRIQSPGDHEHLMTDQWGGVGLLEETPSGTNELIQIVTLGIPHKTA